MTITNSIVHQRIIRNNWRFIRSRRATWMFSFQVLFYHHNLCLHIQVMILMFSIRVIIMKMNFSWNDQSRHLSNMLQMLHQRKRRSRRRNFVLTTNVRIRRQWPTMIIWSPHDVVIKISIRQILRIRPPISTVTNRCPICIHKSQGIRHTAKRSRHVRVATVQIVRAVQVLVIVTLAEVQVILPIAVNLAASKWRKLCWINSNCSRINNRQHISKIIDATREVRPSTRATHITLINSNFDTIVSNVALKCEKAKHFSTLSKFQRRFKMDIRKAATLYETLTTTKRRRRLSYGHHRQIHRKTFCRRRHKNSNWVLWVRLWNYWERSNDKSVCVSKTSATRTHRTWQLRPQQVNRTRFKFTMMMKSRRRIDDRYWDRVVILAIVIGIERLN